MKIRSVNKFTNMPMQKLTNNFQVLFFAAPGQEDTPEHVQQHLEMLSTQLVECQLPTEVFGLRKLPNTAIQNFKHLNTTGEAEFTFQDDFDNSVQEAVNVLERAALKSISALVVKLGGNKVLEAHYLTSIRLLTLQHSPLTTVIRTGEQPNQIVIKTLSVHAGFVQRAMFSPVNAPTVEELIKQL